MDYYDLGVSIALMEKISSAKWREMLREGALPIMKRIRLRKFMRDQGYTAEREIAGLNRGTENIMKEMGLKEHLGVDKAGPLDIMAYLGSPTLAKRLFTHGKPDLIRAVSPATAIPGRGTVIDNALTGLKELLPEIPAKGERAALAVVRRHEADELRAMRRLGVNVKKRPGPDEAIRQQFGGAHPKHEQEWLAGKNLVPMFNTSAPKVFQHAHPRVILDETRNLRMIPTAKPWLQPVRKAEYAVLERALGADPAGKTQRALQIPASASRSPAIKALAKQHEGMLEDVRKKVLQ